MNKKAVLFLFFQSGYFLLADFTDYANMNVSGESNILVLGGKHSALNIKYDNSYWFCVDALY